LKHFISIFYILLIAFSINTSAKEKNIRIVFAAKMPEITNSHGYYPELATLLKQQRKLSNNTYFYFGGDSLGPSTLSSLDQGSHIIDLLNSLEPDAMGVGKRDFSFDSSNLSLRSYDATFPLIATNIVEKNSKEPLDNILKSAVSYQGSTKLGLLSIIDDNVIEAYAMGQISLTPLKSAITEAAKKLRKQNVDAIILQYSGYYSEINDLLNANIIDLSIHKDESSRYTNKVFHERDIFIQNPKNAAVIMLTTNSQLEQPIININWKKVDMSLLAKDENVKLQTQNYINRLNAILHIKIGVVGNSFNTQRNNLRIRENSFGNYITDKMRIFSGAKMSIINSGLIRGKHKYKPNEILTRGSIINEIPYRNYVVIIELTGLQLVQTIENALSLIEDQNGRFPQISGFTVIYDSSEKAGSRVKSIMIDGQPIIPKKVYRIATTDYLASGGDGYEIFKKLPKVSDKFLATRLISDIVIKNIIKDKTIYPTIDNRLIDINKSNL